jgi:cation diffusion facilitator CzcD-associated flavoprotein CzcO
MRRPTAWAAPGAKTRIRGIACDVPSHLYTYSFAPNPDWSHVFSPGAEILGYLKAVANRHGVAGLVRYGTEVRRLEYDGSRWRIELATGERDEADILIAATGALHHPRYPDIDGLEEFAGAAVPQRRRLA